ncbi:MULTISPECIES: hypothetical protein [Vibrio harveyi group]|uniref:hypothetical protein n=1 Tax=Vibrio harveyi group TaxID=717610 RepID=UPI00080F58B1|nr:MULTISPECIES: hypothetical protein [Vibrio harveyi group]EGQ8495673.1 hypothetical protein [Vibrio alginolyticus]MCR9525647.1 hypothetical protein [Vibrio alginolyticus]OCH66691.1 hypothetical protein A6E00_23355 [Vibrio diabolicus]
MLEKISYLGHELKKAGFEMLLEAPDGNGFYKYSVENDSKVEIVIHDDETKLIQFFVESSVIGYLGEDKEDADNEKVFCLELAFNVNFEFEKDIEPVEEIIADNQWFFENYAHLASKEIADSILQHNNLVKNTYLPSHRIA